MFPGPALTFELCTGGVDYPTQDSTSTTTLSCSTDQLLYIDKAKYGVSTQTPLAVCQYRSGDCTQNSLLDPDVTGCLAETECQIQTRSMWLDQCQALSTYRVLQYHCIPGK